MKNMNVLINKARIEKRIEELKKNQYGIIVKKNQKNMLITTSIKFPKEILKKEYWKIRNK